jgi:glutathionylspermidine synthase
VAIDAIGVNGEGASSTPRAIELQAAFKLYPWEFMLREPYAAHLKTAGVRWLEPAWKAILSNKGILPLLWERHPGHPNLLEAYFEDDPRASALGPRHVRKPLFSREGANIEVVGGDEPVLDQGYGEEGAVLQAYHPPADFGGKRPVIGAWIVGNEPAGIGVREDDSVITKNLARFVPHIIEAVVNP